MKVGGLLLNIFNETSSASQNTMKFLSLIAQHLSGRRQFRGLEYKVLILPYLNETDHYICISEPGAKCFKDRYSRRVCDTDSVCDHVCKYHMCKDIMSSGIVSENIVYKNLVPGMYMYQKSITGKSRRWVRVPSLYDI